MKKQNKREIQWKCSKKINDNNKLICKPTITNTSSPNVVTDITGILISVEIDKSVTEFEIIK